MKINNSWPDAATYRTLTVTMARTAAPHTTAGLAIAEIKEHLDEDTDTYVVSTPEPQTPLTVPHLYARVELMGPHISNFPLSVKALIDIGCPSTVISDGLVSQLGLRRFPLPKEENNLSSLLGMPLNCREFVKLRVSSGNGMWESGVFQAKVNIG
jgi:hypothetical protein